MFCSRCVPAGCGGQRGGVPVFIVVNREMAGRSSLSGEGSQEVFHCSWCGGRHGVGGSGKEVVENQMLGNGGESPGERWYNLENSLVERRSLLRLECELDASLWFEHDGGKNASLLWLT